MELLSFVAMEPPVSFEAAAVRAEKVKVWRAIQPIHPTDTARGQYGPGTVDGKPVVGYRQEDRVNPRSQTETYAALRVEIENWRWAGVPFYIRAGKRLAKRVTEITIQFKQPPLLLFKDAEGKGGEGIQPNVISMRIQPDGASPSVSVQGPGPGMNISPSTWISATPSLRQILANGYERLLLDAMLATERSLPTATASKPPGLSSLPSLKAWAANPSRTSPTTPRTWGPSRRRTAPHRIRKPPMRKL